MVYQRHGILFPEIVFGTNFLSVIEIVFGTNCRGVTLLPRSQTPPPFRDCAHTPEITLTLLTCFRIKSKIRLRLTLLIVFELQM